MRNLVLLDNTADDRHIEQALAEVAAIYRTNTNLECTWEIEKRDFSTLRFEEYRLDSWGMDRADINADTKDIWQRWEYEVDNVIYLVHDDHWLPGRQLKRIWGWNLSVAQNGYNVQQCRIDPDNVSNTIGTLYHELMHCKDTYIWTMTNVDINSISTRWNDWDNDVVHGGRDNNSDFEWDYIRYKQNQPALKLISSYLEIAARKRVAIYKKRTGIRQEIVRNLEKVVVLLREQVIRQTKVPVACTPEHISNMKPHLCLKK